MSFNFFKMLIYIYNKVMSQPYFQKMNFFNFIKCLTNYRSSNLSTVFENELVSF